MHKQPDTSQALAKWIPAKLWSEEDATLCQWLYTAEVPFTDPFFDETILKCLSHPHNSRPFRCASTLSEVPQMASSLDAVHLTAFIFHVSRCGSTLLSQLLGMDERVISLAEVPFLDAVLNLPAGHTNLKQSLFASAVRAYGQKRSGKETHLFVKTDSWHLLHYDTLRTLYPETPVVLLYRHPAEVLASHRRHRGMQAVPGVIDPALFGSTYAGVQGMTLDEYTVWVLAQYLKTMHDIVERDPSALLLNYTDGAMPMIHKIAAHTGMTWSPEMLARMEERAGRHSKFPGQAFAGEHAPAYDPGLLQYAMPWYERLEQRRLEAPAAKG